MYQVEISFVQYTLTLEYTLLSHVETLNPISVENIASFNVLYTTLQCIVEFSNLEQFSKKLCVFMDSKISGGFWPVKGADNM